MISKDSIVYRTGQLWKLRSLSGVYVSAAIMIGAQWFRDSNWFQPIVYFGTLVAAASLAIPGWGIRCPRCGARWFWLAISQKHTENWYKWLTSQSTCPVCGYNGVTLEPKSDKLRSALPTRDK
jgi:hypothetical protein